MSDGYAQIFFQTNDAKLKVFRELNHHIDSQKVCVLPLFFGYNNLGGIKFANFRY